MLDSIIESIVDALVLGGVNAVEKYPTDVLDRSRTAVCVSLRYAKITASGCGNYIGLCTENGVIKEMLGSKGELGIGLDIYSPVPSCEFVKEKLWGCLADIGSLTVKSFEAGEVAYDGDSRMFCCKCTLNAVACLVQRISNTEGGFELEEE